MVRRCGDLRSDPVRGRGIGGAPAKIAICHNDTTTLNLNVKALRAHLRHGDTFGACGTVCACQPSIDPVTCEVGGTFINQCIADCAGAEGCARLCVCAPTYDPVTCADGNTYANACVAECAQGANCERLCACQPSLDPIVCDDGITYINGCVAACAGAENCTSALRLSRPYSTPSSSATARPTSTSALPSASGRRSATRVCACQPSIDPVVCSRRSDLHQPVRRRLPGTAGMLPDLRLPARDRPGHLQRTARPTSTCARPLVRRGGGCARSRLPPEIDPASSVRTVTPTSTCASPTAPRRGSCVRALRLRDHV